MAIKFYYKKTCGTCKKARGFLEANGVDFQPLDIITEPPPRELLEKFIDPNNVKAYLNPRSAIYRQKKLGQNPPTKEEAIELMLQDPNLIKRPFIVYGDKASFGFKEDEFREKWVAD